MEQIDSHLCARGLLSLGLRSLALDKIFFKSGIFYGGDKRLTLCAEGNYGHEF